MTESSLGQSGTHAAIPGHFLGLPEADEVHEAPGQLTLRSNDPECCESGGKKVTNQESA